ncbi:MAG TPA: PorP/SprF family type IX secretion system membrane protein [Sphingobacteriaceae bacterium]
MKKFILNSFLLIGAVLLNSTVTRAQLNPLSAQYYSNEYLANPAMAAASGGIKVFGGLRQQWSMISGTPFSQAVTAEFALKEKAGLGLNLWNEQAGLIKTTRLMGSYAYHLPLNNENQKLHFGLSLGVASQRLMNEKLYGDPDDPTVGRFNDEGMYVDGDFGVAYTDNKFSIQAAIPNLNSFLKRDQNNITDRSTYYAAVSYRYAYGPTAGIEPKLAFRGVQGHTNIVDAGVNVSLISNQLLFTGMYHSSQNATFGLGMNFRSLSFLGSYTTETSALRGYTSGNFEIGVGYRL